MLAIAAATVLVASPITLDWSDPIDLQSRFGDPKACGERGFTNIHVTRVPRDGAYRRRRSE